MSKKFSFRITGKKKETEEEKKSSGKHVTPTDVAYTKRAPVLETVVDRLYRQVLDRKKIAISEAAGKLDVSEETIVEWGKILEDHNMIEIRYPAFGKAYLMVKKDEKEKKK